MSSKNNGPRSCTLHKHFCAYGCESYSGSTIITGISRLSSKWWEFHILCKICGREDWPAISEETLMAICVHEITLVEMDPLLNLKRRQSRLEQEEILKEQYSNETN
jgi:hypothetical protein